MSGSSAYVIAGAGLAGAKAAETLREEGFDGPVVLIGDEAERPYERPPLSKDYLLGKAERDTIYVHPASWYADNGVELRLGVPVTGIDRAAHEVALADDSRIGYARLLLATGSSPRRLRVPGADADGVLYLRRVGDSDQIKATFQAASRIAVIGAGWIGLECAAAARAAGVEVTLLEAAELPLLRVLGPEVARVFAGLHREHGVDLRFGVQVSEITTAGGSVEHFNEETGAAWIERVARTYPACVWLNPVPEEQWDYTYSIRMIRQMMSNRMYPLTLVGLDKAMRELVR